MGPVLRFCLLGEDDRVFIDELVGADDDVEAVASRHAELARELASRGVATRLIASDPDGDLPTVILDTMEMWR